MSETKYIKTRTVGGSEEWITQASLVSGSGGAMVYPSAGIALSTGSAWAASISNNSANWNTAYTHSQIAGGNSVHVSTTENTNWDTAYTHTSLTNNPHTVTATQVSLGNVTNESKATMFTSPTFTGTLTAPAILVSDLTASQLVATDASKNLVSLAVATYPSLTEISYVKNVTSAIQTQFANKQPLHASLTSIAGLTEAAGTLIYATADNAYAVLAAGATTQLLVGGGAAAPVWTEASGTGAPIRAGSPTFTTQITSPLIYGGAAADGDITIRGTSHATKTTSYVILQDTGGYVGIGTTAPAGTLHISQSVYGPKLILDDPTTTNKVPIEFRANNVVKWELGQRPVADNHDLRLYKYDGGYTTVMEWDYTTGNVGIGFTAPLSKLCIDGGLHVGGESAVGDNNLLVDGTIKSESIESVTPYTTGWYGDGYKVIETGGKTTAEFDNVIVRNLLKAFTFEVDKIDVVGGRLVISPASGTVYSWSFVAGTEYILVFDTNNNTNPIQFVVGDYVSAQTWKAYDHIIVDSFAGVVTEVTQHATLGSAHIHVTPSTGTPWNGMRLAQFGSTVAGRQSLLYLTSAETNNPFIEGHTGVTAGSLTDSTRQFRLGNLVGITDATMGALTGYGLYSQNAYLKGKLVADTGYIGGAAGWVISAGYIKDVAGVVGLSAVVTGGDDVRFWAGHATPTSAPFRVTEAGSLTATGVAELGTATVDVGGYVTNVAIKGPDLWENAYNNNNSALYINRLSYGGGTSYYRQTFIGDGKGGSVAQFTGGGTNQITTTALMYHSGRIAINDVAVSSIATSALLDLQSTTKALIVPRMTEAQANAMTKVAGMIVYMTDLGHFYGYTNAWRILD